MRTLPLLIVALSSSPVREEDARPRQELERQLAEVAPPQPAQAEIYFSGLDAREYLLDMAEFELDGKQISVIRTPGTHTLFKGPIEAGKHELVSRLHIRGKPKGFLSFDNGERWKLAARVTFETFPGMLISVRTGPELLTSEGEAADRFRVVNEVTGQILRAAEEPRAPRVELPPAPTPAGEGTTAPPLQGTSAPVAVASGPTLTSPTAALPAELKPGEGKSVLHLEVTSKGAPIIATARAAGSVHQERSFDGKSAKLTWELPAGEYWLEALGPAHLGRMRKIEVRGSETVASFELAPLPKKRSAVLVDGRLRVRDRLRYGERQAALSAANAPLVADLIDALTRSPGQLLLIEGHTDDREVKGEAAAALSQARAQALADALIAQGAPPQRLRAVGLASKKPRTPNLTPRGRGNNRRVELSLAPETKPDA